MSTDAFWKLHKGDVFLQNGFSKWDGRPTDLPGGRKNREKNIKHNERAVLKLKLKIETNANHFI